MSLLGVDNWLKSPLDRDIIARWTVGAKQSMRYTLALPQPPDPAHFEFLALGDTGDSESIGASVSPQDAVAQEMAADTALPDRADGARLILHVGDVVYMTGERRLYDRNFRRPYAGFLTPESTVDNFLFRVPFLPVPGNHDYYDLGRWARLLSRVPLLGRGLRVLTRGLFAFRLPEGGSDMGRAYMGAFVEAQADTRFEALPYRPGEFTRLPNRYYRFRVGSAEFFALDSNTLDAPAPGAADAGQVRRDATRRIASLEAQARALDRQLRHNQRACEHWKADYRQRAASDPERRAAVAQAVEAVSTALAHLEDILQNETAVEARASTATAVRRWSEAADDLKAAGESDTSAGASALQALEEASEEVQSVLSEAEGCLTLLPEGDARTRILSARDAVERSLQTWTEAVTPLPTELCTRLHQISEAALDIQRELALERRRTQFRPEDYDADQIAWLRAGLEESARARPDHWRIVYLHHPLYTAITNHCERADVVGVRENLLELLRDRAHLVLAGHSHAFEWFHSAELPYTGLFVTGGGGQVSLRRSLLDPQIRYRHHERYTALRQSGVVEYAVSGRGPAAEDGENGSLYHYLRVEVSPDALTVRPVGVRRLTAGYRRETPMPVYHAPELAETRARWRARRMEAIVIRRNEPPLARWA